MPYPENPTPDELKRRLDTPQLFEAFNSKPKNGIEQIKELCEHAGLNQTQTREQIAWFFVRNPENLNTTNISDYLGTGRKNKEDHEIENEEVLRHFAGALAEGYKDRPFIEAFRGYLGSIELPAEGQKLARMMNAFGQAYVSQNPKAGIPNGWEGGSLALALLVANKELHDASVAASQDLPPSTLKRFIEDINYGKKEQDPKIDQTVLERSYNSVSGAALKSKTARPDSAPSYELNAARLKDDKVLEGLAKELGKKNADIKNALGLQTEEAKLETKKPWLGFLTGCKSKMTISDENGNKVSIEITQPGIFSRSKNVTVSIKPENPRSTELAAQVASKFGTPALVKATYHYQRQEMTRSLDRENLSRDSVKNAFDSYAMKKGKGAELRFLEEVKSFQENVGKLKGLEGTELSRELGELHVQAFGIQQRFLTSGAELKVNIDPGLSDKIDQEIETLEQQFAGKTERKLTLEERKLMMENLFSAAGKEVNEHLQGTTMQQFKKTDDFRDKKKSVAEATLMEKAGMGNKTAIPEQSQRKGRQVK